MRNASFSIRIVTFLLPVALVGLCAAPAGAAPAECVDDLDCDGVVDAADNCPDQPNADQADIDADGAGDVCDCNDANAAIHPGAAETCDGYDEDCDGAIDEDAGCVSSCPAPQWTEGGDVTVAGGTATWPTLVWNGSEYGVAWEESAAIRFAVLDTSGGVIAGPVDLGPGLQPAGPVWTGSEYAVVHQVSGGGIALHRIDASGTPIGSAIPVAAGGTNPVLAWNGSEYGLVWRDGGLRFERIDATGQPVSGSDVGVVSGTSPALVWNGSGYGLAYAVSVGLFNEDVFFILLDTTGSATTTAVQLSPMTSKSIETALPEVSATWTGSEYGVAWQESDTIRFARVDSGGSPLGSSVAVRPTTIDGSVFEPWLTWTGSEYGLSWFDSRDNLELYFTRLDPAGVKLFDEIAVGPHDIPGRSSLVWNGSEYGIVWNYPYDGSAFSVHFTRLTCSPCIDGDSDGSTVCDDCDDTNPAVYPGAPQVCDGVNNDCDDASWPALPANELDGDSDGWTACQGDCDDTDEATFPAAPELCDGIANDCDAPGWPAPPAGEVDDDGDGVAECAGDCDDTDATRFPGAAEVCNAVDDDCDALVDEDALGEDTDGDGVHNLCDNCRDLANSTQIDTDADGRGNSCDNCLVTPNPDQTDSDADGRGNACDNCALDYNPTQDDSEGDGVGDACDNCLFVENPNQSDDDSDSEGDVCDVDDGLIYVFAGTLDAVEWQEENGFVVWNVYRGDLDVLRSTGVYTQDPGSNPLAERSCDLMSTTLDSSIVPSAAHVAFVLVSGTSGGVEGDLGMDSAGALRPNANPCP